MTELDGRVALVTGGGSGLGAAICRTLGAAGATIVAADLRPETATAIVRDLSDRRVRALALGLDVGNEEAAAAVVRQVLDWFGRLDILINNAGTDVTASLEELTFADWDRVQQTNLRGPFVMTKVAWAALRARKGQIVNVVSTAAKRAWANAAAYHASKWGLLGFSHALHVEGRASGIKVTAVIAGGMRTPFLLDRFPDLDPKILQDPQNVAETIRFVLTLPAETVVPEMMVLPMRETSWP
jgi:NAD(P)-dependent dehydrogenase (short-subunit alcohol dehydrogenase family)